MRILGIVLLVFLFLPLANASAAADSAQSSYHALQKFSVPGEGSSDYISVDSTARRLYVSHGTRLEVLDADTGEVVGQILDTPGVHGAAIAPDLKKGFTSNGRDKSVTIFDTETLKTIKKVTVGDPDFILYDSFSKRVFPLSAKVTVIDAITGNTLGEVDLGGTPEAGASDGNGTLYVNLVDKGAVAVVDVRSLKVTKTFAIDRCTSPRSLLYDGASRRLFVGCTGWLAVLDAATGRIVGGSLMCSAEDAAGWDPDNKLIFESCAEGVISIIRQRSPDYYELVDTVKTEIHSGTMAFDSKTKKIFQPTAKFETVPNTDSKYPYPFKPQMIPGSFSVLVVGK